MVTELRRRVQNITPYRATLWLLVVLVLVLLYLQDNPWRVHEALPQGEGTEITREARSDVLIVLDYESIRNSPAPFATHDWSAAWINMMEQEVGPVGIATTRSLSQRVLDTARVVVLTSSVTRRALAPTLRARLVEHVKRGGVLVMERPTGKLRELFAADGRANVRRGERVTFVRGLQEPYHEQLRSIPLSTDYIGSTGVREGAVPLMAIDGALVIYALPVEKGTAITIDFDLGEQLVSMQQGRPGAGYRVKSKAGGDAPPRTSDLVSAQELVGHPVPLADLLERFIVHGVIGRYHPMVTFWAYPGGARGMVIGLHEDQRLGDGAGWMLDYERMPQKRRRGGRRRAASSTLLLSADAGLTAAGGATIQRMGGDVGLLWRLPGSPVGAWETVGLGSFQPVARPVQLKAQLGRIKEKLPSPIVRTARSMGGWWTREWDGPFTALAKQKIRVDMSYATPRVAGYAFGTGFPFLTLTTQGVPTGVRELPVVVPEHAIEGPSFKELLERSQRGHHTVLTLAASPAAFADYPDMERFQSWLQTFELIEQADHRMTSAQRFDTFLRRRRASSLRSRLVRDVPMLLSSPGAKPKKKSDRKGKKKEDEEDAEAELPRATLLRITVESKGSGLWLAVPERVGGRLFAAARQHPNRVGGEVVSAELHTDRVDLVGFELRRIKLDGGYNTIDVYYR